MLIKSNINETCHIPHKCSLYCLLSKMNCFQSLILFAALFSISKGTEILDVTSLDIDNLKFKLDENFVHDFLARYEAEGEEAVSAIVNEYADKLLKNIEEFALDNNLEPINLKDVKEKFLTASITLTRGNLNGVTAVSRAGDVVMNYNPDNNILDLHLPMVFSNLNFTYHYHVIILLIGPKGSFVGKIDDFQMDVKLQFDLNSYHASINEISTSNKGHVTLQFNGNTVLVKVANILTKFVTTVLHPVIGSEIEKLVQKEAAVIIKVINDAIDAILPPATRNDSLVF